MYAIYYCHIFFKVIIYENFMLERYAINAIQCIFFFTFHQKILHFENLLVLETCFVHIYQVELSGTLLWGMLYSILVESDWTECNQRT